MTEIYKLLFDISFYYTLSGYFCYMFTQEQPVMWGIPLIIVSFVINVFFKKTGIFNERSGNREGKSLSPIIVAIFCCALPAFILLFDLRLWQFLQFLPAWAYSCFAIISGRLTVNYSEFDEHFAFTGKLHALLFFGIIGFSRIPGALTTAIPYLTVYLFTGVFLMRILREDGKLSTARNVTVLLIMLFGAAALAWLDAPHLLLSLVGFIYRNVIIWVISGLVIIAGAIGFGIYMLIAGLISLFGVEAAPVELDIGAITQEILGDEVEFVPSDGLSWLRPVMIAIAAIFVVLILFLIFKKLLGNKAHEKSDGSYKEEKERLTALKRSKIDSIRKPKDPRLAIRWYYKKYLKEGLARGAILTRFDTSKKVMENYRFFFDEPTSEQLRDMYIISRYSDEKAITKQDADTVNELWRKLSRKSDT